MPAHASRGLIAGLAGAVVLIIWITVVDVVRGQPLATPAYLAGLVFSFTTALPATARLAGWVILTFIVIGFFGLVVARLIGRVGAGAGWLVGIAAGLLLAGGAALCSAVIYRVNLVQAIGSIQLVGGGVVAGLAIVLFLRPVASPRSEQGQ